MTDFHVGFPIFLAEMLFILPDLEGSISSMFDMQDLCNSGAGGMWGRGSSGDTRLHGVKIMPGSFAANGQMPKGTRTQKETMGKDVSGLIYHISPPSSPSVTCHT